MLDAFRLQNDPRCFLDHGLGASQRGRIRQLRIQDQITLVLLGNETGRDFFKSQEVKPTSPA